MEQETSLARSLRTTSQEKAYDSICKKLLSEKIILAWILKDCVSEYQNCSVNEIAERYIEGKPQIAEVEVHQDGTTPPLIHGMTNEDSSVTESSVRYDVLFRAVALHEQKPIQLILNVEAQHNFNPGYPLVKRGIYYCGRMLSAQNGREFTNAEYGSLKKVYSIWVCTKPTQEWQNTITRYAIEERQVVGSASDKNRHYDLMTTVLVCTGTEPHGQGVLRLLEVLLSSNMAYEEKHNILQHEFHIPMTRTIQEGVEDMCNLGEGIRIESYERGHGDGTMEAFLVAVRNLMKTMSITAEQAMEAIQIPMELRSELAARL